MEDLLHHIGLLAIVLGSVAAVNLVLFAPLAALLGGYFRGQARKSAGLGLAYGPVGLGLAMLCDDKRPRCLRCRTVVRSSDTRCRKCHTCLMQGATGDLERVHAGHAE